MPLAYFKCRHAPATPSAAHFPGPPPPVQKDARWAQTSTHKPRLKPVYNFHRFPYNLL